VPDLDVPASVSTVQADTDSNRNQTNVTELLAGLPGVTALDRQNYAQDTQLSIRGFGSRATFGVRGLRLYVDGIPASMPDGQGQLSHFNVLGADTMQVLRGPFSALYGNSSGGVVQVWSSPGTPEFSARARATYGSFDAKSFGAQGLGTAGPVDYNLSLSRFETDGYRDHSAARRDSANLRLGIDVGDSRTLALIANYVDIPEAQDTLGLPPNFWRTNPRDAITQAEQFNTRKSVEQLQGGAIFEQRFDSSSIRAVAYGGNRKVVQYLAIPAATQNNALHSGGVVDLDSDYRGADLRWSWTASLADRPLEITLGGNYDEQEQLRRGYLNYTGTSASPTALGVRGTLRRDETDTVDNFDQFVQAWWQFADQWSLLAGARHSKVKFEADDRYITGAGTPSTTDDNPDDSGSKSYGDSTVVGGLMYRPIDTLRLYASVGDGFQTPTFNELAYRADGGAGFAFSLRPERSHNYELGTKWRPAGGAEIDVAIFRVDTRDELAVVRNAGGRASYQNVPDSRREGLETSLKMPLITGVQLEFAYTLLDAEFRSAYQSCPGTPCTAAVTVPPGSRIPGVPRHQGRVRLAWAPGQFSSALEFVASSGIVVTDSSQNAINAFGTDRAPGYGLLNADIGYDWRLSHNDVRAFARVENLLDKKYVGSVIVNEANSRFFESGPERSLMAGLQWRWR
jgi:iron complex outermembrane receptor protein